MWLRDDGIVGQTRTVPGGINYWRGDPNQGVMMMPTAIQGLQALVESQQQLRDRIRNIFHVDVLQMIDQREMTLGKPACALWNACACWVRSWAGWKLNCSARSSRASLAC